jgi:hypothetical protein
MLLGYLFCPELNGLLADLILLVVFADISYDDVCDNEITRFQYFVNCTANLPYLASWIG